MRIFVVGAGVSKSVEYPLGPELFSEVDQFVRSCGRCIDRFRYDTDWPELRWLLAPWQVNPIATGPAGAFESWRAVTGNELARGCQVAISIGGVICRSTSSRVPIPPRA